MDHKDGAPYNRAARAFHWGMALVILGLLPLGFFMGGLEASPFKFTLYGLHKSFGMLVLLLVAPRIVWRLAYGAPGALPTHARWERALAYTAQFLLYAGMIGMPLSGWLMSGAGGFSNVFFGLFSVPPLTGKNETLLHLMRETHEICAFVLLGAVALHGTGAFKHHILDRDATLRRMLPRAFPRVGAVLAGLVFICGVGGAFVLALGEDEHEHEPSAPPAFSRQTLSEQTVPEAAVPSDSRAWTIVAEDSHIVFETTVQGLPLQGRFEAPSGTVLFEPDDLVHSRADVSVPVAGVRTGSPERDSYIAAPAWLAGESFPTARFICTDFAQAEGEGRYIARGHLTLRGVTVSIAVPFTFTVFADGPEQERALAEGAFTVRRLEYGIGAGEWSDPALVSPVVRVSVSLVATRALERGGP